MTKIQNIKAIEILDSRGNTTIEVMVGLDNGVKGVASVPSGASKGKGEAVELGALKAVENVNEKIADLLKGQDVTKQEEIDRKMIELDGTSNKSKLGGNAILGVSLACARTASRALKIPLYEYIGMDGLKAGNPTLPTPMMNIINGGLHSDAGLSVQEFMIVPADIKDIENQIMGCAKIYQTLKTILRERGYSIALGDEGGFAPRLKNSEEAMKIILEAVGKAGYNDKIKIALDVAASTFYQNEKYKFEGKKIGRDELIEIYKSWITKYPIMSLEDPVAEEDKEGWKNVASTFLPDKIMIVGDDLFVTNTERLKEGIESKIANAIIIKPNQVGTLTETLECIKLAKENHYKIIVSHRSGDTTDPFIADLAVSVGADYIKAGAPARGERVAKYNRLLEMTAQELV